MLLKARIGTAGGPGPRGRGRRPRVAAVQGAGEDCLSRGTAIVLHGSFLSARAWAMQPLYIREHRDLFSIVTNSCWPIQHWKRRFTLG